MNELFTYLFDEDVLKNKLREKWIKLYDFNFVDKDIIGGLLTTKKNISDLLTFIYNKATASNLPVDEKDKEKEITPNPPTIAPSTTLKTTKIEETKDEKFTKETTKPKTGKKVTIPVPFNLSENKPRVLQEPMAISNQVKIKPLPLANYKKTSLKEIEEKRKEQLQIIKENIIEKNKKAKLFDLKTDKRPTNTEKVREEVENKIKATLQFDNKYMNPIKDFSKCDADVRYNEAAIIREEYLIDKKNKEEEAALNKILVEKKDSKEFERWQSEMKIKDDIIKMQEIEKRKLELELNREVASTYMQRRIQKNQLKAAEHKKQELINMKKKAEEKAEDIKQKKEVIKEIHKEQENVAKQKAQKKKENQELYKNRKKEYNELNLIAQEEKKILLERRDDLIRQIRELEKLPIRRTTGFDPTETPGYGLLEEMSLVELRERLALQKRMHLDEIKSKKEENKLRMQERADELVNKAQIIQENRDRLRNMKEIERKAKKDAIIAEKARIKAQREKSLFEVKQKIENKKQKLKREDEIFQKKIREIKLQRQFLQLGRDAVEFKQFKQIEDGVERKINDRQNQDLIDQLALEKIKWVDVKIRHTDAKKINKNMKEMINNYNNAYELSGTLNQMIGDEDKMYKKAVYDRERALNKYLQDDIKEKNKFCFEMQQKTMKKNKSHGINNRRLSAKNNEKMNNTEKINLNNEEEKKVNEGSDEEEKNEIQNKIDNENTLSQNQAIPA
jgi:hypothetical protein